MEQIGLYLCGPLPFKEGTQISDDCFMLFYCMDKCHTFEITSMLPLKVVRDPCQKITLLLLKSKSVRVIVPESCFPKRILICKTVDIILP